MNSTNNFELTYEFYTGLTLALFSTIFIGSSFIFKKLALIRISSCGTGAGDGSLTYLCEWRWWMGFSFLVMGECLNFIAYIFAPAILVTPLGGLSVVISTVLSIIFLDELMDLFGVIGCFISLFGSTLIVFFAPKEQNTETLDEMWMRISQPSFLTYVAVILVLCAFLIFVIGPRYGKSNPVVYTTVCGSIGSLSVLACKAVGIGLKNFIVNGSNVFAVSYFWFFLIGLFFFLSIQMYHLNKALDLFKTSIITPLIYVIFTGFVITASSIIFSDQYVFQSILNLVGLVFGCVLTTVGIVLLTAPRNIHAFSYPIVSKWFNTLLKRHRIKTSRFYVAPLHRYRKCSSVESLDGYTSRGDVSTIDALINPKYKSDCHYENGVTNDSTSIQWH